MATLEGLPRPEPLPTAPTDSRPPALVPPAPPGPPPGARPGPCPGPASPACSRPPATACAPGATGPCWPWPLLASPGVRGAADKAAHLMGCKSPYRQLPDSDG